jgi:HEAT repeat protein
MFTTNEPSVLFLWGLIAFLVGTTTSFIKSGMDGGKSIKTFRRNIGEWLSDRIKRKGGRKSGKTRLSWVFSPLRRHWVSFSLMIPGLLAVAVGIILNLWDEPEFVALSRSMGFLSLALGGWFTQLGLQALILRDVSDLEAECVYAALAGAAGTPERFNHFFSHPELDFRFAALRAYVENGRENERALSRAIETAGVFLSSKEKKRRKLSYTFLSRRAPEILREKLPGLLEHALADVRMDALDYVHLLSHGEKNAALKLRLSDPRGEIAARAAGILGASPKTVEEYLSDLTSGTIAVRTLAAEYFAGTPDARAFEGLAALLNCQDWRAQKAAAIALGKMFVPEAESVLVSMCINVATRSSAEKQARRETYLEIIKSLLAHARNNGASSPVVHGLSRLVEDPDLKVAKAAAAALTELGQNAVLIRLFETGGPVVREIALHTLAQMDEERLGGVDVFPVFRAGLESPDANVVRAAISGLSRSTTAEDAMAIVPFLKHNDTGVAHAAVVALGRMAALPTLPHLVEFSQRMTTLYRRAGAYADAGENRKTFAALHEKAQKAIKSVLHPRPFPPPHPVEKMYCRKCRRRFRVGRALDSPYAECKSCRDDRHVIAPVDKVVGMVGELFKPGLRSGVFYTRLWDEETKTALAAEIDEWMVADDPTTSFDWAVNAVMEKLQESGQTVGVKIVGLPPLSANTMAMLRAYDPALLLC